MKTFRIILLLCILNVFLSGLCFSFTVEVKDGQGGRTSSSPKPSPSPGTFIPAEIPAAPVAAPTQEEKEIVKNPMEIDVKNAQTPPPAAKAIEEPPPPPNNMPIILGGVAGVIIILAGIGFFLHKKNSGTEF